MPELYNGMSVREAELAQPRNRLRSQPLTRICANHHQENRVVIQFDQRQRFDGLQSWTVNFLAASFVFELVLTKLSCERGPSDSFALWRPPAGGPQGFADEDC